VDVKAIICPVEFSEPSRLAFEYAQELASRLKAKLLLVHVNVIPDVYATGYAGFIPLPPFQQQPDPRLEQWQAEAVQAGVSADAVHLVGIPEHSIVSFAKQISADLIVLGTHGYHGVTKFVMGSVADYVMRHAPCDTLVIRGRQDCEEPTV
jgi:nucleotide-binding universal stress UspA family protein